jgi:glucosamine--fructose-6-phosphate aminotransferase (isomerizing)
MCGIVAATTHRDVSGILVAGLRALEYRGYDSAGIALQRNGAIDRLRTQGKVRDLEALLAATPLAGVCGIAHTRWATHGVPNTVNAHPHLSGPASRWCTTASSRTTRNCGRSCRPAVFESDTDTEVMGHLVHRLTVEGKDLFGAVREAATRLRGAFAIAVLRAEEPGVIVGARSGSPLVLGIGFNEHYLASDIHPLLAVTNRFVYLEEGDVVRLDTEGYRIHGRDDRPAERPVTEATWRRTRSARHLPALHAKRFSSSRGRWPKRSKERIGADHVLPNIFGWARTTSSDRCGSAHRPAEQLSRRPGGAARWKNWPAFPAWWKSPANTATAIRWWNIRCSWHFPVRRDRRHAGCPASRQESGYLALAICNVPESSIVREAGLVLMSARAGDRCPH